MQILQQKIILASKSPRRRQLLQQAGFQFEVRTREVEETFPPELPVEEVAAYLATKKAEAVRDFLTGGDEIILTADSVVILNGKFYGKATDLADAAQMLRELSGNVHEVITGVCLLSAKKEVVFSGVSRVHFAELSKEEIQYYVNNYEVLDKAGSYAIQEWIGLCCIEKIEGSYSNIMGLPMELVYQHLKEF
jgi:septum formation protein